MPSNDMIGRKPSYAYEAFPWIEIDHAWTVYGFFDHRATTQRKAWGQVLAGTDEQLIDAAVRLGKVSGVGGGITDDDVRLFYAALVKAGRTEEMLARLWAPKDDPVQFFMAGILAERKRNKGGES